MVRRHGPEGRDAPGRPDVPTLSSTSPRGVRRRHARLPAAARRRRGRGPRTATPGARRTLRRFEPTGRTSRGSTRRSPSADKASAARSTTSASSPRRSATRTTSSRARRLLQRASSARSPHQDAACARRCGSCRTTLDATERASEGRPPRAVARADARRRCGRPPARSGRRCARCARSSRDDDAGDPGPAAAVLAATCADGPALRPAARDLAVVTPGLTDSLGVVNSLFNELAYNPPGKEEGYLFWTAWANHLGARDLRAAGRARPIRRGQLFSSLLLAGAAPADRPVNPVLGMISELLNAPTPEQASAVGRDRVGAAAPKAADKAIAAATGRRPARARREGRARWQKQAPSVGRILSWRGSRCRASACSLYLWLAFGGPIAAASRRATASTCLQGGRPARAGGRRADLRRARRQGQEDRAPTPSRAARTRRSRSRRGTRRCRATRARSCARRRCSARPYVELTPGATGGADVADGGRLPPGTSRRRSSSTRSSARSTRARARAFQTWMQQLAIAGAGPRPGHQRRRSRNFAPFARGHDQAAARSSTATRARGAAAGRATPARSSTRSASATDQLQRADPNSNSVFGTTAARNQQLADTFRAADVRARVARDAPAARRRSPTTANPLDRAAAPGAPQLGPTFEDTEELAPDLRDLFVDLGPLIRRVGKGVPAASRSSTSCAPFLGELDPPLAQLNPILGYLGAYPSRADAFFAQRRRGDAGDARLAAATSSTTCAR